MKNVLIILIFFNIGCSGIEDKSQNNSDNKITQEDVSNNFKEVIIKDKHQKTLVNDTLLQINGIDYNLVYSLNLSHDENVVKVRLTTETDSLIYDKDFYANSFVGLIDTSEFKEILIKDVDFLGLGINNKSNIYFVFFIGPNNPEYYVEIVAEIKFNGDTDFSIDGFE